MKKILLTLLTAFAFVGIFISSSPSAAALGGINDFTIQDYQIDYYLGRDDSGRSTLKTVELITALFPSIDQNHGIERAIPSSYDGHPTNLIVESVTSRDGASKEYSTYDSNGNQVLRIGNADTYVHGEQTYKITYMQRDVTKYFKDTDRDEFYWDTNGTEWKVPINSLTTRLHIDEELKTTLTSHQQCYSGKAGMTTSCAITTTDDGFTATINSLEPYENMTLAVGFKPHSFATYKLSTSEILSRIWTFMLVVTFPAALSLIVWFVIRWYHKSNRAAELKVIVPEYIPPKDTSISTAASIVGTAGTVFSAQLIDFAVRHYIKIYQTQEKSFFRKANYELEIMKDISSLKEEEQELFKDIFGDTGVGMRLDMATLKNNRGLALKLSDNKQKLDNSISGQYALRARDAQQSVWFKRAARNTLIAAALLLSPWLLGASVLAFVLALTLKPLTDKGLALSRYLKGLKMYIETAETDRLRMLQSPEGAAKLDAPVDTNDKRQLIKLYERVLPYAILFGQEKDWNRQLGRYYESLNEQPTWFSGRSGTFNALAFGAAVSSFNSIAAYSDPSSSSSGGSGGGGSSGGGGGGGGGGGW